MEIATNVDRVTVGQGAFVGVYAPNMYLVTGDKRAVVIDTAYGKDDEVQALLESWESHGKPELAGIVLTHRHGDHIGGAIRLQDSTGAAVICSTTEEAPIREALKGAPKVKTVGDGETLDLGGTTLEFIDVPGHTVGSICIYMREERVLFTGDTILGVGSTVVSPDHGDMTSYMASLGKLLNYDSRIICPGHGPVINEPRAKIQELIKHRLDREAQILDLVQHGRSTIVDLFESIYTELDKRLHDTARSQIRSHLRKLEREGKVAPSGADGFIPR